ncbi:MAG: hypothetical protein ACOYLF_05960 [Blastocatellia bacterium]|jgi:hypothetical protein
MSSYRRKSANLARQKNERHHLALTGRAARETHTLCPKALAFTSIDASNSPFLFSLTEWLKFIFDQTKHLDLILSPTTACITLFSFSLNSLDKINDQERLAHLSTI